MSGVPWRTARRVMALSQGNSWYRISNRTSEAEPHQLHIYDEIGMLGVSANDLIDKLAGMAGPIDVHLNSPGGEVFEGLAIYNALLQRDGVTVFIDGMAASIASVIAMSGEKVKIARSARMMVHDGFCLAIGNAADMRKLADQLDFESNNIARIYAYHTGQTEQYWRGVMREEKWYNADDAIKAGLAHEIIETRGGAQANPRNQWDMSIYQHALDSAKGVQPVVANANVRPMDPQNAALHQYHGEHDVHHEPVTGVHTHNHGAFGASDHDDGIHHHPHMHNGDAVHGHEHVMHEHGHDHIGNNGHRHAHPVGMDSYVPNHLHMHTHDQACVDPDHDDDNDATAKGDTDHDYWAAPARNSIEEEERNIIKMHLDLHNAGYDSTTWDGDAAIKSAASSSNPASALGAICAGKRGGDPKTEDAHALPHHKHPGSPPNRHGVSNALARISGTDGLTNKSAAQAHLEAHAAAWKGNDAATDTTVVVNGELPDDELNHIIETLKGVRN
jgi:ATP-dependent protease ClpP protease subunit